MLYHTNWFYINRIELLHTQEGKDMHFKTDFSDELSTSVQDSAANLYTQQVKPEDQSLWIKPEAGIFWILHCYLAFTVNYSSYYPSTRCSFIFAWYSYLLSLIAWLTFIISLGNSGDVKEESLKTITLLENKISLAVCALKNTSCNYSITYDFVIKNMSSGLTRSRTTLLQHE